MSRVASCGVRLATALALCSRVDAQEISELSLEELTRIEVTSVSKAAEPLRQAPASIYVITHDDIARSGVTSLAAALRLAPNLHLSQYTANNYVAGARGLAGAVDLQNFSNKLLILIDGRSVYSPLFSGVYLDVQDVMLEDVERIEVISGAGATLWGANAMHGVVNVITRSTELTEGVAATAIAGNQERRASLRVGDRGSDRFAWRVYGRTAHVDGVDDAAGRAIGDDWSRTQAGFRADWSGADDGITVQGDVYRGLLREGGPDGPDVEGTNLVGRWQHRQASGDWQLQGYYDRSVRLQRRGGPGLTVDTFDAEWQQRRLQGVHRFVWGAGARLNRYVVDNSATLLFLPASRDLVLANLFVQDTLALGRRADLTLGLKGERVGYGSWYLLPDLRLSFRPADAWVVWGAASRAIRSPTPFDRDVVERTDDRTLLVGNPDFGAERVDALEIGLRLQPHWTWSMSASVFAHRYAHLRTIEPASPDAVLPLSWGNGMRGGSYGAELWFKWQVASRWRLSPGVRMLDKDLRFRVGANRLGGLPQAGNDPRWQALLGSSLELAPTLHLESLLRHVDDLPSPHLAAYTELDATLDWRVGRAVDLLLTGRNLLHDRHAEYPPPNGAYVPREWLLQLRWRPEP